VIRKTVIFTLGGNIVKGRLPAYLVVDCLQLKLCFDKV